MVVRYKDGQLTEEEDILVAEEPLEIRVQAGEGADSRERSLSVTMRTPGHDFELAAGFLFTESVITGKADIVSVRYCETVTSEEEKGNVVKVALAGTVDFDAEKLIRHFYTSSSCGVCGKTSLEAVKVKSCYTPSPGSPQVPAEVLLQLPALAEAQQTLFRHTGGIHAATLFTPDGKVLLMREDVGRHNAVDKVIGAMLMQGSVPLQDHILLVSGRAGFELVQKAAVAGIPVMASVGAPSSLAVQLAEASGITLIGFLRNGRFNIYSGADRVIYQH